MQLVVESDVTYMYTGVKTNGAVGAEAPLKILQQ